MKTNAATARDAPHARDVRIGKDILELVSSAMYVEPLTAYREYLQNAADSIEAAREMGLLGAEAPGTVDIDIDQATRTVRIRDNGTGIPSAEVVSRLLGIGGSAKRGTKARGFRGVGRLAALGYAQSLTFRTRADGEASVSQLVWDARRIRDAMSDPSTTDLAGIVASVVDLHELPGGEFPDRFFEVEIGRIVRQRGDRLLNVDAVTAYLRQVAPVPFSPAFPHAEEISSALRAGGLAELIVRIDGGEPLDRPHRDTIPMGNGLGAVGELEVMELPGLDGGLGAIGWFVHHDYQGAIPTGALVKGVRVRMGNVQIGDHTVLQGIFPEDRFNSWSIGEVHVFDRRIVPNGRRDDFEANAHYANVVNQLSPLGRDIARRCRTSSARRSKLRDFETAAREAEERLDVVSQGGMGQEARTVQLSRVRQTVGRMRRVLDSDIVAPTERSAFDQVVAGIETRLASFDGKAVPDPLAGLPEPKRETYREMIDLIYECSANRVAAKALVDRIMERIAA